MTSVALFNALVSIAKSPGGPPWYQFSIQSGTHLGKEAGRLKYPAKTDHVYMGKRFQRGENLRPSGLQKLV